MSSAREKQGITTGSRPYLDKVYHAFEQAIDSMDLKMPPPEPNYPIRPIVELPHLGLVTKHTLQHSNNEHCLMESSENSVRLSFCFKQQTGDTIDQIILNKYMQYFQRRAEIYKILRREPLCGYSISILVTIHHVRLYGRNAILDNIVHFLSQIDKECSQVKISINARARLVAADFLKGF